jgi:hypothetical protein
MGASVNAEETKELPAPSSKCKCLTCGCCCASKDSFDKGTHEKQLLVE